MKAYTLETVLKWKKAMEEGVESSAFRERFGVNAATARDIGKRMGVEIPRVDRPGDSPKTRNRKLYRNTREEARKEKKAKG